MDVYTVRIDGITIGRASNLDEAEAHAWVAKHRPGKRYTVTTISPGKADVVRAYEPR